MTQKKRMLLVMAGLLLTGCSHKLAPAGHYQPTPVIADGMPDEWQQPLRFSNENRTIRYDVTNDDSNMYVCILSKDDQTIIRILRAGMTIYFDPRGEKAEDISLHYPLRKQPDPYNGRRNGEPLTNQGDSGWKAELVRQSDDFGTIGFSGIGNGQFSVTDPTGPIRVGMKLNDHDSVLVCEAVIPLRNILGNDAARRSSKKTFSVGIVLNTPVMPSAGSPRPNGEGSMHGVGMGMRGFGGGGGRRYGSGNNRQVREDASWYQFLLAGR